MPEGQPFLYYVDPTEEIAGVLRGIKHANAVRVAVVLPKEPRLFRNDINLRLIAAYAREGAKEVALITPDKAVARVAAVHGLRVYETPELAWSPEGRVIYSDVTEPLQRLGGSANPARRRPSKGTENRHQRLAVLGLVAVAIVSLLYAFTPKVTVVVTPTVRKLERQLTIPLITEGTSGEGVVLHTAESVVEAKGISPATGHRLEGVTAATGSVLLFNETNKEIIVPVGTLVATDGGQQFATQKAVRVPPLKPEYFMNVAVGMKAGQAEISVRTSRLGSGGNVSAGRISKVLGDIKGLKVINPEPTRGGTDRTVTFVTQDDISTAKKKAVALLQAQAKKEVRVDAGDDAFLLTSLLEVQEQQVTASPTAEQEGSTANVVVTGHASAPYVLEKDVRKLVTSLVDTYVPAGLHRVGIPEVTIDNTTAPASGGQFPDKLTVLTRIPVGSVLDPAATARMLVGMTPEQARQVLVEGGDVGDVSVKGWVRKRLPRWTPWIRVVVSDSVPAMLAAE